MLKNCCDEYCANHGCNQGRNCPARTEPAKKSAYPVWLIYFEAALFFVAIVMCYVCIVTWGAT